MFFNRFRRCPECKDGYLDNYELSKASRDKPAICGTCNQGFIRFGISGWGYFSYFSFDFIVHMVMFFGGISLLIYYGVYEFVAGLLTMFVIAFLLDTVGKNYGILIKSPNRSLLADKEINSLTIALIAATAEHDIALIKALLNQGAGPKDKDFNGFSAMDHARGRGYEDVQDLYKAWTDKQELNQDI